MSSVKRDHTYFIEMTSELGRIIGDGNGGRSYEVALCC